MKKLAVGILAHVDAGKTTLSEAMLYACGQLARPGRVDHGSAFLDTHVLERERGITIFSKQAVLRCGDAEFTLLDTPGHVDFSAEAERVLQVLDIAVLVISGSDGVQGHTKTLWQLLERYGLPVFVFVNKMDLPAADRDALLEGLERELSGHLLDFGVAEHALFENIALCDDGVLKRYLVSGRVEEEQIAALIAKRQVFPCYFGSALKMTGVQEFLNGLSRYSASRAYPAEFGARVFKITRDSQGRRLTHLKITGGSMRVKDVPDTSAEDGEKVNEIRIYSGEKYAAVDSAQAGTVCAVTGLSKTYPGQVLGRGEAALPPALKPVFTYQVLLEKGTDPFLALQKLRQLEEEDPALHIVWNERLSEIHIEMMGEVQIEVLTRLIVERFQIPVRFGEGRIVYRETIAAPVIGIGHFEPLRHYAEVHLLLNPLPRGSGLRFSSDVSGDILGVNWQNLVLTHLQEREHIGVLAGCPITDMEITLIAGRAHEKHTEGGDFRQATYRALRQGLMCAESILLEPFYEFWLTLPNAYLGRALSDIHRLCGECGAPESDGEHTLIEGSGPVSAFGGYPSEVTAYTRGEGHFRFRLKGYYPCRNPETVLAKIGYDAERDTEHTPDSVFCAHGAGFTVKWDRVEEHAHLDSKDKLKRPQPEPVSEENKKHRPAPPRTYAGSVLEDKELRAIFEKTYGPVKERALLPRNEEKKLRERSHVPDRTETVPEYLLVDGYNIIFAWDELKDIAKENIDAARRLLMDALSNYKLFRQCEVILVFDAYNVPRNTGEVTRYHNISVVYTKEAETADTYIEKASFELSKKHRVRVATSDYQEQLIIMGHGAQRLSAQMLRAEVLETDRLISELMQKNNKRDRPTKIGEILFP